jgi:hypothetical protein
MTFHYLFGQILDFGNRFYNYSLEDVSECILQHVCCPTYTVTNSVLSSQSAQCLQCSTTHR